MKKQKDHWKELLPYEKKFEVASYIALGVALIVFVFEGLDIFGILPVAFDLSIILRGLMAVFGACQAVVYWRKERHLAHVSMMIAIVFGLGAVWDIVKLFI